MKTCILDVQEQDLILIGAVLNNNTSFIKSSTVMLVDDMLEQNPVQMLRAAMVNFYTLAPHEIFYMFKRINEYNVRIQEKYILEVMYLIKSLFLVLAPKAIIAYNKFIKTC